MARITSPTAIILLCVALVVSGCVAGRGDVAAGEAQYSWMRATERAAFPGGYGFPVFVAENRMWAFHHAGIWHSSDGATWTRGELPAIRPDAYSTRYVQFGNAIYALGENSGNYLTGIKFDSKIRRTTDFRQWETIAEDSELPARVFHGSIIFANKMWLFGGFDGERYHNDVWHSTDGVRWTRAIEHAAWSERNPGAIVVFKNRIWMFGGGVIDGERDVNPDANAETWSSVDGVNWRLESTHLPRAWGGAPVVFNDKLWLVGANRDGQFARAVLVSKDGITWQEKSAPWSPRGAVAAWVFDNKLYMTGGKYSEMINGEPRFIYSNDVWYMTASSLKPQPLLPS